VFPLSLRERAGVRVRCPPLSLRERVGVRVWSSAGVKGMFNIFISNTYLP